MADTFIGMNVSMTETELKNIWNYFLSLEKDLSATSQYIEPKGQENVFSFEFAKLIILACTETEAVLKLLSKATSGVEGGNIGEYKGNILTSFPKIIFAEVYISRWGETIRPFKDWGNGPLDWWDSYVAIKHNRKNSFPCATYKNAVYSLSALYILIHYLSKVNNTDINSLKSTYIRSAYSGEYYTTAPDKELPDFDTTTAFSASLRNKETATINFQEAEPTNPSRGNIWFNSGQGVTL